MTLKVHHLVSLEGRTWYKILYPLENLEQLIPRRRLAVSRSRRARIRKKLITALDLMPRASLNCYPLRQVSRAR